MPLTCTICNHPDRTAIEREIIRGTALRVIAGRFPGTSRTAIGRHKLEHLGVALIKAQEHREIASGSKVLAEIESIASKAAKLYDMALELVQEARDAKDRPQALAAIDRATALLREARANAGLVATLTGELNQSERSGQVAVLVYPSALPPGAPCDLSQRPRAIPPGDIIDVTPADPAEVVSEDEAA